MSTLTVTAEPLTIHDHPNADRLQLAQVGLYNAVVPSGVYRTGDFAIYIPEGAVLPPDLIDQLGLTGKLAGPASDRVKAVRLRGELSQGIVCLPPAMNTWFGAGGVYDGDDLETHHNKGTDFADLLGITKYVPPIPTHLTGKMVPAPDLLRWVEVENIRRYPDMFAPGERVVATEKIHGTCCLLTVTADGATHVTSKGFGSSRLAIVEDNLNVYWRAVHEYDVAAAAAKILDKLGARRVGVFGEVYGAGIQDLAYGAQATRAPGYAAFDIAAEIPGEGVVWLAPTAVHAALDGLLPTVPVLYEGPYDEATLVALAEGLTVLGDGAHIREGIVVRPDDVRREGDHRMIGKLVSPAYLTRKGGTEYE